MSAPSKQPEYANRYAKLHRNGYRATTSAEVVVRIIKALNRIGYGNARIAAEVGLCGKAYVSTILNGKRPTVSKDTERRFIEAYHRLHLHPLDTPGSKRTITYAVKRRFPGPMAWDDITDPNDKPEGVRRS